VKGRADGELPPGTARRAAAAAQLAARARADDEAG
jgi:hypothetical protein